MDLVDAHRRRSRRGRVPLAIQSSSAQAWRRSTARRSRRSEAPRSPGHRIGLAQRPSVGGHDLELVALSAAGARADDDPDAGRAVVVDHRSSTRATSRSTRRRPRPTRRSAPRRRTGTRLTPRARPDGCGPSTSHSRRCVPSPNRWTSSSPIESASRRTSTPRVGCAAVRVLMLSWDYPPQAIGGTAAHVAGLSRRAAAAGHDVVVLTIADRRADLEAERPGPVRVVRAAIDLPWLPPDGTRRPHGLGQPRRRQARAHARRRVSTGGRPTSSTATTGGSAGPPTSFAARTASRSCSRCTAPSGCATAATCRQGTPTDINAVEWWLAFQADRLIAPTRSWSINWSPASRSPRNTSRVSRTASTPTSGACRRARVDREPLVVSWGRVQYEKGSRFSPGDAPRSVAGPGRAVHDRRARELPARAPDPDRRRGCQRPRSTCPASSATTRCVGSRTAPVASSSRRCTSHSASSRSRRSPPAPRSSSPAPAGWPS